MGARHTPGPWIARCEDREEPRRRGDDDDGIRFWSITIPYAEGVGFRGTIATVSDARHIEGISLSERDANACLIGAAPDLLAALESAPIPGRGEEMMAFRDRQDKWLRDIRNPAIAKAMRVSS